MVWSIPKYDDFVITEYTIINDDAAPFRNMFLHPQLLSVQVTRQGRVGELKTQYDTEYIWDEKREVFVFYDDNSIPINTERAVVYDIAPGNVTGDVGDPGNIKSQGSIDYQLYSPQVVGHGFVDVPPNAFGESKVHHSITNYDWRSFPHWRTSDGARGGKCKMGVGNRPSKCVKPRYPFGYAQSVRLFPVENELSGSRTGSNDYRWWHLRTMAGLCYGHWTVQSGPRRVDHIYPDHVCRGNGPATSLCWAAKRPRN